MVSTLAQKKVANLCKHHPQRDNPPPSLSHVFAIVAAIYVLAVHSITQTHIHYINTRTIYLPYMRKMYSRVLNIAPQRNPE